MAVISYDPPEILAAFSKQRGITFPLLSDAGSATIKRYGILNPIPEAALGPAKGDPALKGSIETYVTAVGSVNPRTVGMAFPGTFVVDRQGKVTSRFFEDLYFERSTTSSLMLRIGAGAAPVVATKVATSHLEMNTYASDSAVAPGNRFAIAVNIVPRPGMHVYAPGASGYQVLRLTIAEQPFIKALPTQFPASETYFFAPLNERVPVYQKPFTMLQQMVLEGTPQAQAALKEKESITLSGTLDYQACDDKICYNPASIPVSWTLALRPILREPPAPPR
jgi:hypothetical protein